MARRSGDILLLSNIADGCMMCRRIALTIVRGRICHR
jgi:hypothetical protein